MPTQAHPPEESGDLRTFHVEIETFDSDEYELYEALEYLADVVGDASPRYRMRVTEDRDVIFARGDGHA